MAEVDMQDNMLFRVGDWDQGEGDAWNKIEEKLGESIDGGYSLYRESGMYGLAAFYDRERDLFSIKEYYHCSCEGTNYEDAGPQDARFNGTPQQLKKIVLENADYSCPMRRCHPRDRYYRQTQLLYHVFALWLSQDKPAWEGKGRAYHVDHGAYEPKHFRDTDEYLGDD
ncbi:hypothetical protein ABBQ32_011343 [Trebouxia sp. C0010 RCD-2024]